MHLKRMHLGQSVAVGLLALTLAGTALAQRIPASSSDSGRRAVVAIDQASINTTINNAQNTANHAVNLGNNAQNTANHAVNLGNHAVGVGNNAQGTADWAARTAQELAARQSLGTVVAPFRFDNHNAGGWHIAGLCFVGWDPQAASGYTSGAPVCPPGSGPYVISAGQGANGEGE